MIQRRIVMVGCENLRKDAVIQNVNLFADIWDKMSLMFNYDMKFV
jgi:hypothetical protein